MASLSWEKLAITLGVDKSVFDKYRHDANAPAGRGVKAWQNYLAKFGEGPRAASPDGEPGDLPGECDYDDVVSHGTTTYNEGLTREKVREQMIINEKRKVELDREKGKLITAAEYDAGMVAQQEALLFALKKLPDIAVKDFIPADRPKVKKAARQWIDKIKAIVHAQLEKDY